MTNQVTETGNNLLNEMKAEIQNVPTFEMNHTPNLNIGEYDSIPIDVYMKENVQTEYGLRKRLIIKHKVQLQGQTYEVEHKMNISTSKESRYFKTGKEIYQKLGRNFSWSEVINRPAKIEVGHYTTSDGDVYEYVKEASYDVLAPITLPQASQRILKSQPQAATEVTEIVAEETDTDELNDFE